MKARKTRDTEREITAQPKAILTELANDEPTEEGLSMDPEDMGRSFIRYATEQGNYEGSPQRTLDIQGGSASDGSMENAHFSADGSIWENTVNLAMEGDGVDNINNEASPGQPDDSDEFDPMSPDVERGVAQIDLTESVIDEASLLDEETDVLGEVIEPQPITEDSGTHGKRRRSPARRG